MAPTDCSTLFKWSISTVAKRILQPVLTLSFAKDQLLPSGQSNKDKANESPRCQKYGVLFFIQETPGCTLPWVPRVWPCEACWFLTTGNIWLQQRLSIRWGTQSHSCVPKTVLGTVVTEKALARAENHGKQFIQPPVVVLPAGQAWKQGAGLAINLQQPCHPSKGPPWPACRPDHRRQDMKETSWVISSSGSQTEVSRDLSANRDWQQAHHLGTCQAPLLPSWLGISTGRPCF